MIDGASQSENRFVIDGQDTTNLRTGLSGKSLVVDFIEQIQVKQSGYNAEYRATTGGVVSVITKSGTNAFHGTAAMDYNGKALNGLRRRHPSGAPARPDRQRRQRRAAEYFTTPRTSEFERYTVEPIFDFGGPIMQNVAWFYAGVQQVGVQSGPDGPVGDPDRRRHHVPGDSDVQRQDGGQALPVQRHGGSSRRICAFASPATTSVQTAASGCPRSPQAPASTASAPPTTFVVDDDGNTIGTSTSNPATFNPRSPIYALATTTPTAASPTGRSTTRRSRTSQPATWARDPATRAVTTTTASAASSAASNIGYLDVPLDLQHPTATRTTSPTASPSPTITAASTSAATSRGTRTGAASTRSRPASSTSGSATTSTRASSTRTLRSAGISITDHARPAVGARHLRLLLASGRPTPSATSGRTTSAPSCRISGRSIEKLTINYGVRFDYDQDPVLPRREPGHRVRVGQQGRAAAWLRLRHQGRRQVEGLRLVGHLLRHREARDAARRVGRRPLGRPTTGRSTTTTGQRSTATARRLAAARAPTSNRTTCGTCRTTRTTTWSIRT